MRPQTDRERQIWIQRLSKREPEQTHERSNRVIHPLLGLGGHRTQDGRTDRDGGWMDGMRSGQEG